MIFIFLPLCSLKGLAIAGLLSIIVAVLVYRICKGQATSRIITITVNSISILMLLYFLYQLYQAHPVTCL